MPNSIKCNFYGILVQTHFIRIIIFCIKNLIKNWHLISPKCIPPDCHFYLHFHLNLYFDKIIEYDSVQLRSSSNPQRFLLNSHTRDTHYCNESILLFLNSISTTDSYIPHTFLISPLNAFIPFCSYLTRGIKRYFVYGK